MKGRRKLKTNKWHAQERYRFEAKLALANRKGVGLILDKAVSFGADFEPIGKMAGLH